MNPLSFNSATPFHEYLLVLSPDENTNNRIVRIKFAFKHCYGCSDAPYIKPHLTLVNFCQFLSMETHIVKCLEKISRSIAPIPIELSGFGQYPMHTIYAKLVDGSAVSKIVEVIKLRLTSTLKGKNTVKPVYTTDPHLTIARRMLKPQFNPAWSDWGTKEFNSSFWVNGMLLLKRKINQHNLQPLENYQRVNYFPFTAETARPAQLTIF